MMKYLLFGMLVFAHSTFASEHVLFPSQCSRVISTQKIWSEAQHSAFTDLIRFQDSWYCVFRESDQHVEESDGVIHLIASRDGEEWQSVTTFAEEGVDLRDPKLSITPEKQLMLLMGGTESSLEENDSVRQSRVAFSQDGENWNKETKIVEPHEWLWRVTWHNDKAYGVSYRSSHLHSDHDDWIATLFMSDNGVDFQKITELQVPGYPSEATLRFRENGEMIALLRRGDGNAWIGTSKEPFENWSWEDANTSLGGPNFLIFPDDSMCASGRVIEHDCTGEWIEKTVVAAMYRDGMGSQIDLPSGGDTSYPGMVFYDGMLWISYYSSHEEGKTAIYLAKVLMPKML